MCVESVGRVVDLPADEAGVAIIEVDGVRRRAVLTVLAMEECDVHRGDWLLVHTGIAVARVDESEAQERMELRAEMRVAMEEETR